MTTSGVKERSLGVKPRARTRNATARPRSCDILTGLRFVIIAEQPGAKWLYCAAEQET